MTNMQIAVGLRRETTTDLAARHLQMLGNQFGAVLGRFQITAFKTLLLLLHLRFHGFHLLFLLGLLLALLLAGSDSLLITQHRRALLHPNQPGSSLREGRGWRRPRRPSPSCRRPISYDLPWWRT